MNNLAEKVLTSQAMYV